MLAYGEMQWAIPLEMKYKRLRYRHSLHGRHCVLLIGICNPFCIKLLHLIPGVISHNSVKKKRSLYIHKWLRYNQIWCFTAFILSAVLEFVMKFASNIYNLCSLSFHTIQWKTLSILINGWVTANYSVSRPLFVAAILEFVIRFVSNFYNWRALSLRTSKWKMKCLY